MPGEYGHDQRLALWRGCLALELIASGWANPFFANRIRDASANFSFVGLHVTDIHSLRLHLVRAFGSSRRWVLMEIEDPRWQTPEETMDQIRRGLRAQVRVENDDELMKRLRTSRERIPVFIATRMSYLSHALMTTLREALPEVTCLVILERGRDESAIHHAGVMIVPSTSDEDERSFLAHIP